MENSNRMFITMTILVVVFIGFMIFNDFFGPKEPAQQQTQETGKDDLEREGTELSDKELSNIKESEFEKINIPQEKTYDLVFENDGLIVEFDPIGAVISRAEVKRDFLDSGEGENFKSWDLVHSKKSGEGALRLVLGSWKNGISLEKLTGSDEIYHYYREGDTFLFTYKFRKKTKNAGSENDETVEKQTIYTITKKFTFLKEHNVFKLDVHISNDGNVPNAFDDSGYAYSLGWGPGLGEELRFKNKRSNIYNMFVYLEGDKRVEVKDTQIKKITGDKNALFATQPRSGGSTWVAADSRYFTAVLSPDKQNYDYFFDYRKKAAEKFYTGFSRRTNNSLLDSTFYMYVGAKMETDLKSYKTIKDSNFKVAGASFEKVRKSILFGAGDIVGKVLGFIYSIVKNYGLAIIVLTILIKLILFPLTYKSMESQEKMAKLQPKFKELQEKYKDDQEQLNKRTMELYKKEKVNPVGGCLPMLLQMPVFIAMYQLLDRMVELKGASFLWIRDLSGPEALYTFFLPNGFPFGLTSINVNILPIIMVAFQILTTLLTPDVSSNKQTKMMMWSFPLIFFFILYNFASGLVLYWTVMNLLNLIQQVYMKKIKPSIKKPENSRNVKRRRK